MFWGSPSLCFGPSDAQFGCFNANLGKDVVHALRKTLLLDAMRTHMEEMVPPGAHVPS